MSAPDIRLCGRFVVTAAVAAEISPTAVQTALTRHLGGDWGDLGAEDAAANDDALNRQDGGRLMSVYKHLSDCEQELWVITDGYGNDPADPDACYTTVLLPSDY